MKQIQGTRMQAYDPIKYGLLQSKRRLTRVTFKDARPAKEPDKTYRLLLEELYRRIRYSPLAPPVMPERIRAEWREDEQAFVLHGYGLRGFSVEVKIVNLSEEEQDGDVVASQSELTALHGAPLPSLG